ncbi:MAG: dihydroneopterin aldolase [Candidatus Kapaibacteriota bacterium]|jgi:dihydroneopterin aldolase
MFNSSLTKLTIKNVEYYAYHGVKEEERKLGGKYQVDLDMYYDAKAAVINDDVNYAINYEEALFCVSGILTEENYALVETIASEILSALMDKFDFLMKATVRVRKLTVPMRRAVDYIECEQSVERENAEKIK